MKYKKGQIIEIIGTSIKRDCYEEQVESIIGQQFEIVDFDDEMDDLPVAINLEGSHRWLFNGEFKIVKKIEEEKEMEYKIGQGIEIIGVDNKRIRYKKQIFDFIGKRFKIVEVETDKNDAMPIAVNLNGEKRWLYDTEFKIVKDEEEMKYYKTNKRVSKGSKIKIVKLEEERDIVRSQFSHIVEANIGNVFTVHQKDYSDNTMPIAVIINNEKVWLYDTEFRHIAPKEGDIKCNPKRFKDDLKKAREKDQMKIIELENKIRKLQKQKMNIENKKTLIQEYTIDRVLKIHGEKEQEKVFKYKVCFYSKGKSIICEMHRIINDQAESKPYAVGVANCHEEDTFDPTTGGIIAEARALKQLYTKNLRDIIADQY